MTDAQIANMIANGRGKMPAFESTLSQNQIRAIVLHVRGGFSGLPRPQLWRLTPPRAVTKYNMKSWRKS
jgi:Cytochrome C oxidase, cbb3-type, subunit III